MNNLWFIKLFGGLHNSTLHYHLIYIPTPYRTQNQKALFWINSVFFAVIEIFNKIIVYPFNVHSL